MLIFIDTCINAKGVSFCSTFVYSEPEQDKRSQVWETLKGIAEIREKPWFLSEDFNEILENSEKERRTS